MFAQCLRTGAFLLIATSLVTALPAADPPAFRTERDRMVTEFIEREGVKDKRVLGAMRKVLRHEFVPQNLKPYAYLDQALPIGHKQTISPPFVVAYMTEVISPQQNEKILEIGTGSGYQAAVLANLCAEVYSIEIVEPLGKQAAERLKRLGYTNVTTKVGDGYAGWVEHAPFDKIIVTCSPEDIPQPLITQLKEGGRMIIPLGERYQQVFHLLEKQDGKLVATKLIPTLFVPMTGQSETLRDVLPDGRNPELANPDFELDADEDGAADSWHYQRQARLVTGAAPSGSAWLQFANQEPGRMSQALQGMAIDGSAIGTVVITLTYQVENARPGPDADEKPGAVIHFYDGNRKTIGEAIIGPWTGTTDWVDAAKTIVVPPKTQEAIFRIGLNGATGKLNVDDIRFVTRPR